VEIFGKKQVASLTQNKVFGIFQGVTVKIIHQFLSLLKHHQSISQMVNAESIKGL
jgi:hypothetical protein